MLAVSALAALSIIAGCINYLVGDSEITFANVMWSTIQLAAWALWGWFAIPRRRERHPARILYTVWFALPAFSAGALLIMSLIPSSAGFFATLPGNIVAAVLAVFCLPMAGFGFFGSSGYAANDLIILALSVLALFLPRISEWRTRRAVSRRA